MPLELPTTVFLLFFYSPPVFDSLDVSRVILIIFDIPFFTRISLRSVM